MDGTNYYTVRFEATLAASLEEFGAVQQQQYVDRLAATLGVDAASITLSIAPASIVVTASIRTVAPAAALATLSEMASNATKASEILNVVVEAVAALVVESNDAVVHSLRRWCRRPLRRRRRPSRRHRRPRR